MKRRYILGLLLIISGYFIVDNLLVSNKENDSVETDVNYVKHENALSMMLETESGSGEYTLETRSSWPTQDDGYIFNSTLSKCENGSKLSWDNDNNAVIMTGNVSDKCYVYFDVFNRLYTINYDDIAGTFGSDFSYITGPTSSFSGDLVSIIVYEGNIECSTDPIISIPSSIIDLNCTVNSSPVEAPDDWFRNVTISDQKMYLSLNTSSTCTFTMPNENITFSASQVLSFCMK